MVKTPLISVVVITSRNDYPFGRGSGLHCLEPVARTLATQTFHDFELVVVDSHYEARSEWFKDNPQPYPVKHVSASPNHWHQLGRSGACAQINRGMVWADGELVWIGCENNLYPTWFLELAWSIHASGLLPAAWYVKCSREPNPEAKPSPMRFSLLGYTDENVFDLDHRANVFLDKSAPAIQPIPHLHFFNHAGIPRELCLELNGYDEAFDGDLALSDCDVGSRLDLLGYGSRMRMHRDLFVAKNGGGQDYKGHLGIKCNYALYLFNREMKRVRVNGPINDAQIQFVRDTCCGKVCSIRERCRSDPAAGEHLFYPFCGDGKSELYQHWLKRPVGFDLRTEVEKRKHGVPPYDHATVT